MEKENTMLKIWSAQVRGNFLILSVILVALGLALAKWNMIQTGVGEFNFFYALLLIIGVVLTHVSVNLFNEYSDYMTGIDEKTERTPFSGGSGMMQAGLTGPKAVYTAAVQTLFWSFLIGLYFVIVSHWSLLIIMLIGALAIVFYTGYLARWLLGEFFAGFTLGSLVVIGTYIAMTAGSGVPLCQLLTTEVIVVSIPPGILTALLLFLNEFPDMEADKEGGRFHLVIWLGKKKAAYLYCAGLVMVYGTIIVSALTSAATPWIIVAIITIPIALKAGITALRHGENTAELVPAMGMNVIIVLVTDLLMAVGIVIAMVVS